eukprot:2962713-Rhodomonas_salina.1
MPASVRQTASCWTLTGGGAHGDDPPNQRTSSVGDAGRQEEEEGRRGRGGRYRVPIPECEINSI